MAEQLSRAPGRPGGGATDQWGMTRTSTFKVIGRHVFNLWRIMRSEYNLTSYTLESVAFQVLHRRLAWTFVLVICVLTVLTEYHDIQLKLLPNGITVMYRSMPHVSFPTMRLVLLYAWSS